MAIQQINDDDLYIVTHVDGCRLSDNLMLEQAFITFMNGMYMAKRSNIMKEPIERERLIGVGR